MGTAAAEQALMKVNENFKSFFALLKKPAQIPIIPRYLDKDGYFELSYPQFKIQKVGRLTSPWHQNIRKNMGASIFLFPKT